MEQIILWDQSLFEWINGVANNALFDFFFPFIRNKYFWVPFYIFLFAFILINFPKIKFRLLFFIILTVVLTDQLSSELIKPLIDRCRPCNLEPFNEQVRLLVKCGSGRSFVSSHASNHFGLATILSLIFRKHFKVLPIVLLSWAALISYGQVYVGVHFPLDILFGGLLGMTVGYIINIFYKKTSSY